MGKDSDGAGGLLPLLLPIAAVALCCGGPLLIGLLASAAISGAVVAGALPAAGLVLAGAVLMAGGAWLVRRQGAGADCCAVPPPSHTSKERSEVLPR